MNTHATCEQCGVEFDYERHSKHRKRCLSCSPHRDETHRACAHCAKQTTNKRYCSTECMVDARRGVQRVARESRTCPTCGSEFIVKPSDSKTYCSSQCQYESMRSDATHVCQHCGDRFRPKASNRTTYCSRDCAYAAHSARAAAKVISGDALAKCKGYRDRAIRYGCEYTPGLTLAKVMERKGNTCGICGQPIDISVKYPNPTSASLDHIMPMSKRGGHVMDNVQPAHLRCNIIKRDRLIEPVAC